MWKDASGCSMARFKILLQEIYYWNKEYIVRISENYVILNNIMVPLEQKGLLKNGEGGVEDDFVIFIEEVGKQCVTTGQCSLEL